MIRVLIAAPSAVVRAGLETLMAGHGGIEVVGAYADLSAASDLRPDVIVTTFGLDDLPEAGEIREPAFVVLADDPPSAWLPEALRLGVRAVVSKDTPPGGILAAVEAAANGLVVLEPQMLEAALAGRERERGPGEPHDLTAREMEVLGMLAEGAANKNIAWKLGISEHTAKFHVASILSKLNASSRAEAVAIGIRKGLILI